MVVELVTRARVSFSFIFGDEVIYVYVIDGRVTYGYISGGSFILLITSDSYS